MRRVVVTGLGIVSPFGSGLSHNWESLISCKSGLNKITNFDVSDLNVKIAANVPKGDDNNSFNIDKFLDKKEQRKISDFIAFAIAAADEAINDSNIGNSEDTLLNTGVIIGSGIGGLEQIYNNSVQLKEKGAKRVSPFFIPSSLINLASGHVSMKYGFLGPNHSPVTACATGTHAIGDAFRMIKYGDADVMISGGAESAISKIGIAGFAAARALSTNFNDNPEQGSRPWDEDRDGFVMGEGAGILVLEEYERAKKRGAKIYAEIVGYGMSGDAYHITSPHPEGLGATRAMQAAMKDASLNTDQIDYVNAHGTSTPVGDKAELETIARFFKKRSSKFSMSSTKSSIGHLLGAAGSVEAIFSIMSLNNNIRPATLNLKNSIDNHGINLIPNIPQEEKTDICLSNSFGFGGTNASVIFKKI